MRFITGWSERSSHGESFGKGLPRRHRSYLTGNFGTLVKVLEVYEAISFA
jgi:hypothetical protein